MFDDTNVIFAYPMEQALVYGELVPLFSEDWHKLSDGKPIVATATIVKDIPDDELKKLWDEFTTKRNKLIGTGEYCHFMGAYTYKVVWIIESEVAITYMYPHEY